MDALLIAAFCIAGLIIGGFLGPGGSSIGFFAGLGLGFGWVRLRNLSARVDALHAQLQRLAAGQQAAGAPLAAPAPAAPSSPPATPAASAVAAEPSVRVHPAAAAATPTPDGVPPARHPAAAAAAPAGPTWTERLVARLKRVFSEGNVPVKVGMLVLFAGVAALLKYAADEGWLRMPIELRLAGVALTAIAALALGWRQRARRTSFALALQGGAIGVLMLTAFAAFRIYQLMPAGAAFALLLILVAGAGVLAVLQNALALAVLGILAGFAAPILISTGDGSHVVLFTYYAVLNLAIFAIAWHKPWRALNLLGFFFTYAIGTAWGVLSYEPAQLATTQPFLLLTFAIYLAIPILYARRREPAARDFVDGTLVFGNPLFAFALQAALLDGARLPLAFSALALAALYLVLAWRLLQRHRVLGESFAVLAAGFATLAVPLALSAQATASIFALEGAALVWLGLRQQRLLPCIAGVALQLLAAGAFMLALIFGVGDASWPIANGLYVGALLIAVAGFATAWLFQRGGHSGFALPAYLWGLAWWLGAGLLEIARFTPHSLAAPALLALAAATAVLAALAFRYVPVAAPARTAAIALASGVALVFVFSSNNTRPFASWGLAAFAVYAAAGWIALRSLRDAVAAVPALAHIGWLWTWTLALALALHQPSVDAQLGGGWLAAAQWLPLLGAWAMALWRPGWIAAPLKTRFDEYRGALLTSQGLVALIAFTNLLFRDGNVSPLPYVPLLNPVELLQLGIIACCARWLGDATQRSGLLAAAAFAFVTAATLRATHHLGGVPWDENLWSSNLAQTALTLVWSVLGVIGWVIGSRRGKRLLWLAGAVLMGVVLLKLLLIDRGRLGNLFGIVSFIAYGLLCTVIGYFAPAPPRTAAAAPAPVTQDST